MCVCIYMCDLIKVKSIVDIVYVKGLLGHSQKNITNIMSPLKLFVNLS